MASRIATTLAAVLLAARDRLVSTGAFSKSCADIATDPEDLLSYPPGDRFAGVSFTAMRQVEDSLTTDPPTAEVPLVEAELTVIIFHRLQLDKQGSAEALVTDEGLGVSVLIARTLAALHNQELADAKGDYILGRSLTWIDTEKRDTRKGWHRWDVRYSAWFTWDLTAEAA